MKLRVADFGDFCVVCCTCTIIEPRAQDACSDGAPLFARSTLILASGRGGGSEPRGAHAARCVLALRCGRCVVVVGGL